MGVRRGPQILRCGQEFIVYLHVFECRYTNETEGLNFPVAGVDGTDGNHPEYTTVTGCSGREIGLYEKQSSFFIQAKTALSRVQGNVFFNGPRAGINANDGCVPYRV